MKTKRTKGSYEIVRRDGSLYLRFSEDFRTPKAPEPLRILISPHELQATKNKNAEDGGILMNDESILTENGKKLLANFLALVATPASGAN